MLTAFVQRSSLLGAGPSARPTSGNRPWSWPRRSGLGDVCASGRALPGDPRTRPHARQRAWGLGAGFGDRVLG